MTAGRRNGARARLGHPHHRQVKDAPPQAPPKRQARRGWTDDEVAAVVDAYCHLLDSGDEWERVRDHVIEVLQQTRLAKRNTLQIERKLENISCVLERAGKIPLASHPPRPYVQRALRVRVNEVYIAPADPALSERERHSRWRALEATVARRKAEQLRRQREREQQAARRREEEQARAAAEERARQQALAEAEARRQAREERAEREREQAAAARRAAREAARQQKKAAQAAARARRERRRPTFDRRELDRKVAELLAEGQLKRPAGNPTPRTVQQARREYQRLPEVKAWALRRAAGHCELCGRRAPFRQPDGQPYLEVHHITPLAEKGGDTRENTIALCPNCHRKAHFSARVCLSRE